MHFDVVLSVFIHPCTKKKKAEVSSIQYSRRVGVAVCVRALQMCARETSHSARLLLQQSRASFMLALCLRAVLILSSDTWDWTRMHALAVMHRWTLCENVDRAKIKGAFLYYRYRYFTGGIDASYRHAAFQYTVSIHIDESLHPY